MLRWGVARQSSPSQHPGWSGKLSPATTRNCVLPAPAGACRGIGPSVADARELAEPAQPLTTDLRGRKWPLLESAALLGRDRKANIRMPITYSFTEWRSLQPIPPTADPGVVFAQRHPDPPSAGV